MDPVQNQPFQQPAAGVPNPPGFPDPSIMPASGDGSKKGLKYFLAGLALLTVLVAGLGGAYLFMNSNSNKQLASSASNTNFTTKITPTPTPAQIQAVKGTNDLNGLLNELNAADTSSIESDYNKAVSESSNL